MSRILLTLLLISVASFSKGQDPQFSQPYANSLYLNPAFTGNTLENRISFSYRNQWANLENGYSTYMASFDHYEASIKSGFGGYVMHDRTGANGYKVSGFALNYAYDLHIDQYSGLRMGASVGYFFMSFDRSELIFADQIIRGGNVQSVERSLADNSSYFDIASGLMYYNPHMWAGVSVSHVNEPGISMFGQDASLPMKYSVQTGVRLLSKRNNSGKETRSMNLTAHYKLQNKNDQLDLGIYYNFLPLMLGVWYRGIPVQTGSDHFTPVESLIFMIGIEHKDYFRVAYSYDLTLSDLGISTGGSHEISLIYEWKSDRKIDYRRLISCPRF